MQSQVPRQAQQVPCRVDIDGGAGINSSMKWLTDGSSPPLHGWVQSATLGTLLAIIAAGLGLEHAPGVMVDERIPASLRHARSCVVLAPRRGRRRSNGSERGRELSCVAQDR